MDKIEVFHFRVYDSTNDEIITPVRKSPLKRIEMARGEVIPNTGELVLVSELDNNGRYDPRKRGK